ncbi:hypothetical protein JCM5353_002658 [Sporobolomyces roseus]
MVSSAIFLAAIIVPSVCLLILIIWSTCFYFKISTLVQYGSQPTAPPLVSTVQQHPINFTYPRPPNRHLANSDPFAPFQQQPSFPVRPHSFLQTDPALHPTLQGNAIPPSNRSNHRFSIATTVSRSGSRVLTRNPSSQNSHGTSGSSGTKAGSNENRTVEMAKRKRKSYGVGDDLGSPESVVIEVNKDGVRKRRSTWTTEELEYLASDTGDRDPLTRQLSATPTLPPRLSIDLRHDMLPDDLSSRPRPHSMTYQSLRHRPPSPQRFFPPPFDPTRTSPASQRCFQAHSFTPPRPSPAPFTIQPHPSYSNSSSHPSTPIHPFSQPSNDPQKTIRYSSTRRCQTLPLSYQPEQRFSASSQALVDLEGYAANLSTPPTPSYPSHPSTPLSNLDFQHQPRRLSVPSQMISLTANDFQDHSRRGRESEGEMLASRRPISWVKRQGSSGTLPERITDEARLLIANPDSSIRTSLSSARDSVDQRRS